MSRNYGLEDRVPTDILAKRLIELSNAVTEGREAVSREFTMRVPAECDRDADLVLSASAKRLLEFMQAERMGEPIEHRAALQAAGIHPAPCARHCEARAFEIEIRQLNAELKRLRADKAKLLDTLVMALPYVEDAEESPLFKAGVVKKAVSDIRSIIASVEGAA